MRSPVPALVVVTDRRAAAKAGRDVVDVVAAAVEAGTPAVLLRDKDLPRPERRDLGRRMRTVTAHSGARLLVAPDGALAEELGADGVHLAAADPPAASGTGLVGRSCHDATEVAAARTEGVDYAFVSPVAPTTSKPGHGPALEVAGLRRLVELAGPLPVIALGGVGPANTTDWRDAGAHGIAVMGGVMGAADPGARVRALLAAWGTDAHAATAPARPDRTEVP